MASPAKLQVTRCFGVGVHNAKIDFGKLYLHQIFNRNQSDVIEADAVTGLGKTAVNNWEIHNGIGLGAELVAYGKGMHTYAGDWENWLTMVFEDKRFKGSTLQIMGASIGISNEWAIVGGTGDFAMAQGVIRRQEHTKTSNEEIQELSIDGYCRMNLPPVPTPAKMGPWGGNGGVLRELRGKSQRLESVTIHHLNVVEKFTFSYFNEDGQIRTEGPWGNAVADSATMKRSITTIKFGPSEFVTEITGVTITVVNEPYLSNFKIITNVATYGPFGTLPGTPSLKAAVPDDKTVVGFFLHADNIAIIKIGVYTI